MKGWCGMPVGNNRDKKYDSIVAKSPSLLLCKHTMTLTEKKLFDTALLQLKHDYEAPGGVLQIPEGKQLEVRIPANVIKKKLGYNSTNIYTKLYEISENYTKIRFALRKDPTSNDVSDGAFEFLNPFPYCKYEDGVFTMRFESGLNKEIANMENGRYALSDTAITLKFTQKVSSDLYDVICWYKWKGGFETSVEELRAMLGLDLELKAKKGEIKNISKYEQYRDLNRYVLKPAVKEINELSDVIVSYYPSQKKGNKVTYIRFDIKKKEIAAKEEGAEDVLPGKNPLEEVDEGIQSNARVLKYIIADENITENDIVMFLMASNNDQEVVIEKWQMYKQQTMTRPVANPVGWIISAIKKNYKANVEDVNLGDVIDPAPAADDEENEEVIDEIADLLRTYKEPFKMKDIRSIAKQAGYDISKVEKAYKAMQAQKSVNDPVAYMIAAIRDGYEARAKAPKKNGNMFNEFDQREYTEDDYTELERRKLGKL